MLRFVSTFVWAFSFWLIYDYLTETDFSVWPAMIFGLLFALFMAFADETQSSNCTVVFVSGQQLSGFLKDMEDLGFRKLDQRKEMQYFFGDNSLMTIMPQGKLMRIELPLKYEMVADEYRKI